jgi:hypothetical protein
MDKNLQTFLGIMVFYFLLSYVLFPLGFYYLVDKSLLSAGSGFVLGSVISISLWLKFGRRIVKG